MTIVGKLYMKGCPHCDNLEKPWDEMKKKIKNFIKVVDFNPNQMDGLEKLNKKHKTNVSVQDGYPTIFKIENGKVDYYNGMRTTNELVKWAKNKFYKKGGKSKKIKSRKNQNKSRRK